MSEGRIIKKYPNRRLYDTAISSYITLVDVRHLVMDGVDFKVVDAKTDEDITRQILLQIISEEEVSGDPIFSSELLTQVIRSYGGGMQQLVTSYLEKTMNLFAEQQKALREQTRSLIDTNPLAIMTQVAERNLSMWKKMNTEMMENISSERELFERLSRMGLNTMTTMGSKAEPAEKKKPSKSTRTPSK
jgi:polyhydroxyalkanoate synthesis repressor PhaR